MPATGMRPTLFKSARARMQTDSHETTRGQCSSQRVNGRGQTFVPAIDGEARFKLTRGDIAGAVASLTEGELDVLS